MPVYVALDLHRDYVHRCRLEPDADGAKMKHSRFPNTREGWLRFIETETSPDMWVVFEVTGNAFEVHDLLSPHVGRVLVTKATAAQVKGSGRKTDRVDTERLVIGLAQGTLPSVWVPSEELRELRGLIRARERASSRQRALSNQLRAIFRRALHPIPSGRDVHKWLGEHPESLDKLSPANRVITLSLLRQYQVVTQELEALTAEIASAVGEEPMVKLLLTIPGVSLITAAHIYAYLGDPSRFTGPKQVARYAGLDSSVHSSGLTHQSGAISKNGCKYLRTAAIEAAHAVARFDTGPLAQAFRRMSQRIGYNKSITALARKLLIVAWRMMLTGTPYHGAREETTQRKVRYVVRTASKKRDWMQVYETLLGQTSPSKTMLAIQSETKTTDRGRTKVPA